MTRAIRIVFAPSLRPGGLNSMRSAMNIAAIIASIVIAAWLSANAAALALLLWHEHRRHQ
jgi:hypothetical protein